MTPSPPFDDELLTQLRQLAPSVPAEVLSVTGPSAQRVLARALTPPQRNGESAPAEPTATAVAPGSRWSLRQRPWIPALAAAVIAIVVAVITLGGSGSGPSIVARAYAATEPQGVIVHYTETMRSTLAHSPADTEVDEFWTLGQQSRELIDPGSPRAEQDIVSGGGRVRNLAFGRLSIFPSWPANTRCSPGIVLTGDCAEGENNTPIDAIRSLLRSGQLHATSSSTLHGTPVELLTGTANKVPGHLRIRATVDAQSSLPIKIQITWALSDSAHPVIETFTITGYERLPVTAHNRRFLALPPHPDAKVIRFHRCPTASNANKLCRYGH